jgi:hypothetical protein
VFCSPIAIASNAATTVKLTAPVGAIRGKHERGRRQRKFSGSHVPEQSPAVPVMTAQHGSAGERAEQETRDRGQGGGQRESRSVRQCHPEKHDVAGHVGHEHPAQGKHR